MRPEAPAGRVLDSAPHGAPGRSQGKTARAEAPLAQGGARVIQVFRPGIGRRRGAPGRRDA